MRFILSAVIFYFHAGTAQIPTVYKPRETAILTGSLCWTAANYTVQFLSPKIPPGGNTWMAGKIDNYHFPVLRKDLKYLSDATLIGTGILAGLSYVAAGNRNDVYKKSLVTAESIWMSACFTHSIKLMAQRNRPYTREPGFVYSKRDDVYSFFSGHSSMAAAFITSAMLMRNRDEKSLAGQNLYIAGAVAAGGVTAWLRIRAGKHYPSDVLTGLVSGIGIAWLNYKIHEK